MLATSIRFVLSGLTGLALLLLTGQLNGQDPFAEQIRKTDPLSPGMEEKSFQTLPGLAIELVASEPQILKPLNLAFDWDDRLWVTCTQEYPYPAQPGNGQDRIVILEDRDRDGQYETDQVFADDLNIPMGILPYGKGCIVFDIPNICYLSDNDGDGRYDQRQILYGPFDYSRDTHGLNNSFRQGLDGWIYACHGFNNQSQVQGQDGHSVELNSGNTYRFLPDGSRIEHYSHGQVNPFGMTMDPWWRVITADCHSKPLTQVVRNGYYPSFGRPDDGLGFAPSMMEHLHGSTAIAGVAFLEGDHWPWPLKGQLVSGNVMTSRLNRNHVLQDGMTTQAVEQADLLRTSDPWFRPVDIVTGPDGSLYVADFYNRIIGHYEVPLEHPGRDRKRGRIWRIKPQHSSAGDSVFSRQQVRLNRNCFLIHDDRTSRDTRANLPIPQSHVMRLWQDARTQIQSIDLQKWWDQDDPLVRCHVLRVLAESFPADQAPASRFRSLGRHRHGMSDVERWISEGMISTEPSVVLAAIDAASRNPSAHFLERLTELASDSDPMGSYLAKVALKEHWQAIDGDSANAVTNWINSTDRTDSQRRLLCQVALAVSSRTAADFVVNQLPLIQQGPDFPVYLTYLSRHLDAEGLARLVRQLDPATPRELSDEVALLNSLATGMKRANATTPDSLRAWASDTAVRLLATADGGSAGWLSWDINESREPLPGQDPWQLQLRPLQDGSSTPMISSLPLGESLTGKLVTPLTKLGVSLRFQLAGHRGYPDRPAHTSNRVQLRLVESGDVIKLAYPPRNDVATEVVWDTSQWAGQLAQVEFLDGDSGDAYAWLAAGNLERILEDGQRLPLELPRQLLSDRLATLATVSELMENYELSEWETFSAVPQEDERDPSLRYTLLRNSLAADPFTRSMANAVAHSELPSVAMDRSWKLLQALKGDDATGVVSQLQDYASVASTQEQQYLVASSLERPQIFRAVAELVRTGRLSAEAFRNEELRAKVALRYPDSAAMVQSWVNALPKVDLQWREQVAKRAQLYRQHINALDQSGKVASTAGGDWDASQWSANGKRVFEKSCSSCHQIAGQGQVVGPQLDGIGQRGLERVLEDVLLPNQNVDHAFRTTLFQLVDGRLISGLVKDRDDQSVTIADPQGKAFPLAVDDIEAEKESRLSLMPEDIARNLSEDEAFALIYYLLQQKVTGTP